ncbi:hypothetical protein Sango_1158200 [Sesamum angolense]|uniref:HAT C-terminal dimerisation domain-containing protein n=1 Tax=Sesamum angolense TaxID=2727404 RepID=A0AAE2BWL7_9LAMI|nr:hypothetical protein Sango_1158200 [Sesamum angolense]
MSLSGLYMFMEIVKQLQLPTSKGLILDVPTRWNSTYGMIESIMVFRDVFSRHKERNSTYIWLPSLEDWDKAMEVSSESTFSAGGRALDQHRSSLKAETIQALICTGDWLHSEWKVAESIENIHILQELNETGVSEIN